MSKTLLSILITTYNRAYFLRQLLESILNRCGSFDDVEIVVFDNGSTDSTRYVIREFKKIIPNLRSYRVDKTLDFTGGYFELSKLGKGEYFWYIGDDDIVTDSIDIVVHFLKENRPDIALLNHWFYIQEEENKPKKMMRKKDNFLFKENRTILFKDYKNYLRKVKHINGFFTHISPCIVKRKEFLKHISDDIIGKYRKSRSHHIFIYLSVLRDSSSVAYINEKMVCLRTGATFEEWTTPSGRLERIRMGSEYFLEMVKDVFGEGEETDIFKRLILKNDIFILIIGSKLKLNNADITYYLKVFRMLKDKYKFIPFFWYGIVPSMLIPSFLYKLAYRYLVS